VKRLSGAGSFAKWELVACRQVSDARRAEKTCHSVLEQLNARVYARREFFRIDEASAIRVLDSVARKFPMDGPLCGNFARKLGICRVPGQWRELVALRRRHANQTVSIEVLMSEHILERSHLAEARLSKLGLDCVNRCETAVTYRADPTRASGLIQELLQSDKAAAAALLVPGALITVRTPVSVREESQSRSIVQKSRRA
jgi:hypothetical protein